MTARPKLELVLRSKFLGISVPYTLSGAASLLSLQVDIWHLLGILENSEKHPPLVGDDDYVRLPTQGWNDGPPPCNNYPLRHASAMLLALREGQQPEPLPANHS